VRAKVIFQRDRNTPGRLKITGTEITDPAVRLRNSVGRGAPRYSTGVRGDLLFKHPGCWQVNARWGPGQLDFVIRVLDPPAKKPRG
jgi:hypothetical protein